MKIKTVILIWLMITIKVGALTNFSEKLIKKVACVENTLFYVFNEKLYKSTYPFVSELRIRIKDNIENDYLLPNEETDYRIKDICYNSISLRLFIKTKDFSLYSSNFGFSWKILERRFGNACFEDRKNDAHSVVEICKKNEYEKPIAQPTDGLKGINSAIKNSKISYFLPQIVFKTSVSHRSGENIDKDPAVNLKKEKDYSVYMLANWKMGNIFNLKEKLKLIKLKRRILNRRFRSRY